jgi:hypothetical protein
MDASGHMPQHCARVRQRLAGTCLSCHSSETHELWLSWRHFSATSARGGSNGATHESNGAQQRCSAATPRKSSSCCSNRSPEKPLNRRKAQSSPGWHTTRGVEENTKSEEHKTCWQTSCALALWRRSRRMMGRMRTRRRHPAWRRSRPRSRPSCRRAPLRAHRRQENTTTTTTTTSKAAVRTRTPQPAAQAHRAYRACWAMLIIPMCKRFGKVRHTQRHARACACRG